MSEQDVTTTEETNTQTAESATDRDGEVTLEALEEFFTRSIRPVLIQDGGNITLIDVRNNRLYVRLQGACGSCPSSQMTMQMGVERMVKENFPSIQAVVAM
ncbi:MAG: NifU family protein [Planctomycetes bacterium]|nr:NifU family protein [Planctomycetota bacterium]